MATLIGMGSHGADIYSTLKGWSWIAHHKDYRRTNDEEVIIGINNPQQRSEVAHALGIKDRAWRHSNTHIGIDTSWSYGTHINYGVTMTRTTIGHHTTISPGVTICGDVQIGNRCLIGAGATICDRVTIEDDVTVGAGCVVLPESQVDTGATVVGVPARYADGTPVK